MSENRRKHQLNKKIPFILSLVFAGFVLCSFLYSIIQLIIEPTNSFAVENRENISGRNNIWIYSER